MALLTCKGASVSEGSDLRVSEAHQPDDESVQHVFIIEHTVLALLNHTLYELHKVDLMRSYSINGSHSHTTANTHFELFVCGTIHYKRVVSTLL